MNNSIELCKARILQKLIPDYVVQMQRADNIDQCLNYTNTLVDSMK